MIDPRAPFISASSRPALEISRGCERGKHPTCTRTKLDAVGIDMVISRSSKLHIGTYDGPKMNPSSGPDRGDEVSRRAVQPANIWFYCVHGLLHVLLDLILVYYRQTPYGQARQVAWLYLGTLAQYLFTSSTHVPLDSKLEEAIVQGCDPP